MIWRLCGFWLLLAAAGCAPWQPSAGAPADGCLKRVPAIPFRVQQQQDDCGPTALGTLLAHQGVDLATATIAAEVYHPALGGSLLPDLENFAHRQGVRTRSGQGDLHLLRQAIDAGQPVLIPVETGFWVVTRPHYLVVYGYDSRRFLVHDGRSAETFITAEALDQGWAAVNRLYLLLD